MSFAKLISTAGKINWWKVRAYTESPWMKSSGRSFSKLSFIQTRSFFMFPTDNKKTSINYSMVYQSLFSGEISLTGFWGIELNFVLLDFIKEELSTSTTLQKEMKFIVFISKWQMNITWIEGRLPCLKPEIVFKLHSIT